MSSVLYVSNRYRSYDLSVYLDLASTCDLTILWLFPWTTDDPPPERLLDAIDHRIVFGQAGVLTPRQAHRNLRFVGALWSSMGGQDLVICSTAESWKAKPAFLVARARSVPIAFRREQWFLDLSWLPPLRHAYWALDHATTRAIERRGEAVMVGGAKARAFLVEEGHDPSRVHVFPYLPVDMADRRTGAGTGFESHAAMTADVTFLYLGRLMEQKGLHELISAFRSLERTVPVGRIGLVVVGGTKNSEGQRFGDMGAYERWCRDLAGAAPSILFAGYQPPECAGAYYDACDVFVQPSVREVAGVPVGEGYGLTVVEAASAGLVIISSDRVASAFDYVVPGVTGAIVDSSDLRSGLVEAMAVYARMPECRLAHGEASRRHFDEVRGRHRPSDAVTRVLQALRP